MFIFYELGEWRPPPRPPCCHLPVMNYFAVKCKERNNIVICEVGLLCDVDSDDVIFKSYPSQFHSVILL